MPYPIIANLENPWVWLVILAIVFLFFGNKLPQLARSLGSSLSEFKKGVKDGSEETPKEGAVVEKKETEEATKK